MTQTQDVLVDPFLLCLPNPCGSIDLLEGFISALVGWQGLLDRKDARVLLSDSARLALHDDGEFPHRHSLSKLLVQFNCAIADANTISKLANGLLDRVPSLEAYYEIKSVLFDDNSFVCDPGLIIERLKANCQKALKDDLIIICLIAKLSVDKTFAPPIVASRFDGGEINPAPDVVVIKADVHDVESSINGLIENAPLPLSVAERISIAFNYEEFLNQLGLWAVWKNASDIDSIRSAFEMSIRKLVDSGVSEEHIQKFVIGDGFVDSLHKWGADTRSDYAMVTIESCARIVLGMPKNNIDKFRESASSSAKQRKRHDGSLAYRTHLTKRGIGLRLMFWVCTDGSIEFANIGDKDELEIL